MTLRLTTIPVADLAPERSAHFERLREAPDLFLELMLPSSQAYRLEWSRRPVGYCIVARDGTLIELELARSSWPEQDRIFGALRGALALGAVFCLSFDGLLLGRCISEGLRPEVEGLLFRDLADEHGPAPLPGAALRPATRGDLAAIEPHRDGVFGPDEDLGVAIDQGTVAVLEVEGAFAGIGLRTPLGPGRSECDVGAMIHPSFRGRRLAAYVLRRLKRSCLDMGLRPTAGCAVDNTASRKALARAGFVSQHCLLRFSEPQG